MFLPGCEGGTLSVYLASSSTLATVFDPITEAPVANPLWVDSAGYAQPFLVDTGSLYDLVARSFTGATIVTRQNVSVPGATPGPIGPQGIPGVKGEKGDTGPAGTAGTNGADGTNGTNGTNGTDGADGVSLLTIRIDPDSSTGKLLYNLSSDPGNWLEAGDTVPEGLGTVKPQADSPSLLYLNDALVQGDNITLTKSASGTTIALSAETIDELADHGARITAIESVAPARQVLFGGTLGATSVVIPHSLGTSNVAVSCYDGVTGALIFLNVVVTDTQVGISDLAPLVANNQIKVVLVR